MELLAPAGSMEALRAAVCNGADAVYLGADTFNARINARNFSAADLQEAVVYCHVRGVKVHLTLNTLVLDREMPRAAELIRLAASCASTRSSCRIWAWYRYAGSLRQTCPSMPPRR